MKYFENLSLEEFWTRTLQEIDHLYAQVEQADEELSATERNALMQSLTSLRHDGPLSDSVSYTMHLPKRQNGPLKTLNFLMMGNSKGVPNSTIALPRSLVWNAKTSGKRFS